MLLKEWQESSMQAQSKRTKTFSKHLKLSSALLTGPHLSSATKSSCQQVRKDGANHSPILPTRCPPQEILAVSNQPPVVTHTNPNPMTTVSCNACMQGFDGKPGSSARFWDYTNEIVQAALTAPRPCQQAYETQVCVNNCPSDPYGPTSGTFS